MKKVYLVVVFILYLFNVTDVLAANSSSDFTFRLYGTVVSFDANFVEIRNLKTSNLQWVPRQNVVGELKTGSTVKAVMNVPTLEKYQKELALLNNSNHSK